jgi:tripartite-type tricarboxylate transporter receptor subunit TctC
VFRREKPYAPKNFEAVAWLVLLGPRGVPQELVRKIGADVGKALATPEMRKRTEALGFETYQANPAEIAAKIKAELRTNAEVIKRVGAKAE